MVGLALHVRSGKLGATSNLPHRSKTATSIDVCHAIELPACSRAAYAMAKPLGSPLRLAARSVPQASRPMHLAKLAQRRWLQDITITRTGKPIIRVQGGRSSLGGHTATVFGATGFLGRYIVQRLARQGCTVVVPYREEMEKRHLKLTGDLGRVIFLEWDIRNTASIEESVRHSDVVYNLVGRDYPTENFTLEDVHFEGTERIAEAVAKYDIDRFVHVSSYNASSSSPSEFFRTKAKGEEVARAIFPETTIVRPAPMFGFEDRLLHRLANVTNVITANHMQERFWPVHVSLSLSMSKSSAKSINRLSMWDRLWRRCCRMTLPRHRPTSSMAPPTIR